VTQATAGRDHLRMLAKTVEISLRSVQRILEAHKLAPYRVRTFKLSNDPKFAVKLREEQCTLFTIRCFACGALDREVDCL
jgi:hypothetical protein